MHRERLVKIGMFKSLGLIDKSYQPEYMEEYPDTYLPTIPILLKTTRNYINEQEKKNKNKGIKYRTIDTKIKPQ